MAGLIFKGEAVSSGSGVGNIYIYEQDAMTVDHSLIREEDITGEFKKLEMAVNRTIAEISDLKRFLMLESDSNGTQILEVYNLILVDGYFFEEVRTRIVKEKQHADKAFYDCIENITGIMSSSGDEYLRQRISDLNDIRSRVIKNIRGESKARLSKVKEGHVVLVRELNATLAVALGYRKISALAAGEGAAYHSHAAIILRGLGIPVINGINIDETYAYNGEFAVIDGDKGMLVIKPEDFELPGINEAHSMQDSKHSYGPTTTKDGLVIEVSANISSFGDYFNVSKKGLNSVGLVRTEMLYLNNRRFPSEREQSYLYSRMAKKMGGKPVVIRTVDIGSDKIPVARPEMGYSGHLRGIGWSLAEKEQFRIQLKSIISASKHNNISITFPMVNNAEEIREAKRIMMSLHEEQKDVSGNGELRMQVGAVIETRAAVDNIDEILTEVDFINVGTNDLSHEVMGVERGMAAGEKKLYLHPRFLRVLEHCIDKAKEADKHVSVCGEMAADPMVSIILIGMGVADLSMNPVSSVKIRNIIKKISTADAKGFWKIVKECNEIEEVFELVKRRMDF